MSNEINFTAGQGKFFAAFDAPGSASAVLPERARPEPTIENRIVIEDSALPYLVGERKTLAEETARIMAHAAARHGLTGEIRIRKYVPVEPGTLLLEVRQRLATNGKRAMEYYEQLGAAIDPWADALPDTLDKILEDEIHMSIDWDYDAPDE